MFRLFKKITFLPQRFLSNNVILTEKNSLANTKNLTKNSNFVSFDEFPFAFPDFLPSVVLNRRDPLFEELVHADMLERRLILDIPEFYVGSILAVTTSDPNLNRNINRFVGICINRHKQGLQHQFTLRNVIDGLGIEIMYEMYNPTILKIETLKLEKRLDQDLSYLIDALPEYSTFDFNLEPIAHVPGTPVPINPLKVKLRPPPWKIRWSLYDFKGIEDSWTLTTPWYKRKMIRETKINDFLQYDIIQHYRDNCQELERDIITQERIINFEKKRQKTGGTKRRILKLASQK